MKNWEKELARIDKQLESMADETLLPSSAATTPEAKAEVKAQQSRTRTLGVLARLTVAVGLGVGILFWPYDARCGLGLAAYLASVGIVIGSAVWSAVWSWRHRAPRAHILSLLITLWGLTLGAVEILPRSGYARTEPDRRMTWLCP
ncbi:MAG: hypothetical protein ABR499_18385 [Gemmatimonadaceae bacterium]